MDELTSSKTLTEEAQLAWKVVGTGPVPGAFLIVFKKRREGLELIQQLEPGQGYKKRLWESEDDLVGYAVTASLALRHPFMVSVLPAEAFEHVTLHITLHLIVEDPVALVLALRRDPLRLLQDEAKRVIPRQAELRTTEELLSARPSVASVLLASDGGTSTMRGVDPLAQLKAMAGGVGLTLQDIEIDLKLSSGVIGGLQQHELGMLEDRRKAEREQKQARNREDLRQIQRRTEMLDAAEKRIEQVMENIARDTTTLAAASEIARAFARLREGLLESGTWDRDALLTATGYRSGVPESHRIAPGGQSSDELLKELETMRINLVDLDCRPSERAQLVALFLHLIAEASLEERADALLVKRFIGELQKEYEKLLDSGVKMTPQQHDYFRRMRSGAAKSGDLAGISKS